MNRGEDPLPWQDRPWGDVHRAWPLILEPTGLDEPTRPCLGGGSSQAMTYHALGQHGVERRQALALLRLPLDATVRRPTRYLAWVLMRGTQDRADFSSQITAWWPAALSEGTHLVRLSLPGAPLMHVTARGDDRRWATAPVPIPASVLPGEPTTMVLTGVQWPPPPTLTMHAAPAIGDYLDALR